MICDQISARLSVTMLCCCIDREVDPRRAIADIGCPGPESKLLGQNCAFNRRYPPRYPKVAFDSGTRIHTARPHRFLALWRNGVRCCPLRKRAV